MSETLDMQPNVENINQGKRSSGRIEINEIQEELNKAMQGSPNPSKLDPIENRKRRREVQERYKEQLREIQRELATIMQAAEDKLTEIEGFKEEKNKMDVEFHKIIGSLSYKLSPYYDFLVEMTNKINDGIQKTVDEQKNLETETNAEKVEVTIGKPEWVDGKLIVKIYSDEELTHAQKEYLDENVVVTLNNQLADKGINPSDIVFEYCVGKINLQNGDESEMNENSDSDTDFVDDENTEEENDQDDTSSDQGEIPYILQLYFQLTNEKTQDYFLSFLEEKEKQGFKNIKENLKELLDKYIELQHQIHYVSDKIEKLENELDTIEDEGIKCEEKQEKLNEELKDTILSISLDAYQSTKNVSIDDFVSSPNVEKQIKYLIQLHKKGLQLPKTVLLYGGHNNGKTYTANVLASEIGRKMYHIRFCDINNNQFPDPSEMLDYIFSGIEQKEDPCVILLDDMEEFSKGLEGSVYQNQIENTIKTHISDIKKSNLDIMIIGTVSDKSKMNPALMKHEVFEKQIVFDSLGEDKQELFVKKLLEKNNLKLSKDINILSVIQKLPVAEKNHEYLKTFVDIIKDCHIANNIDFDIDCEVSMDDIQEAIQIMGAYSRNSSGTPGYNR